jgi:hypothetical protein
MLSVGDTPQSWWSPALLSPVKPEKEWDKLDLTCLTGIQRLESVLAPAFDIAESPDTMLLHSSCIYLCSWKNINVPKKLVKQPSNGMQQSDSPFHLPTILLKDVNKYSNYPLYSTFRCNAQDASYKSWNMQQKKDLFVGLSRNHCIPRMDNNINQFPDNKEA